MERLVTREEIIEAVAEIGFNHVNDRRLTTHRDDWYLWVTCGFKIKEDKSTEYACWVYNAERKSLNEGYYTTDVQSMREKYLNKR